MTYLSGKAAQKRKTIRYGLYGLVFVLIIIFWTSLKKTVFPIVEPFIISYKSTKVSVGGISEFFITYVTTREVLVKKDKELEIVIERLENELAEKNAKLKELGIAGEENKQVGNVAIIMYPLVQDITKLYSTILLSKGFKDGVDVGDYIYVRGLQPVCIVQEVYTNTSLCKLLSAGGVETEAVAEGTSTLAFVLTGRGGGTFIAHVPRDTSISIGESVYLRSDQSMKIGEVTDVIHNNQDTSWHVVVRGMYNPVTSSIFYLHKK
jgi:cell shape-determining protein MreC